MSKKKNQCMEIKCTQKKEKLCTGICNFLMELMATTHRTPKTETHSFKKEEKEERSMENNTNRLVWCLVITNLESVKNTISASAIKQNTIK